MAADPSAHQPPPAAPGPEDGHPVVVFLCVHNAGRSQMAAAWARHFARGRLEVRSGGSDPAAGVNPMAVEAMGEVGIDLTGARPRPWDETTLAGADVVVTMGCGDTCPAAPGRRLLDWPVADPAGQPLAVVRKVRDDIGRRVADLFDELGIDPR